MPGTDNPPCRDLRPFSSRRGTETVGDVLVRLALEMKSDLVVQLTLDAAGRQQRANAQEQIAEVHLLFNPLMNSRVSFNTSASFEPKM